MPRDRSVVIQELARFGITMPDGNIFGLAFGLMPDETILSALMGKGTRSQQKNYGYAGEKEWKSYDNILLAITNWRLIERVYKVGRNPLWEVQISNETLWQRIESFSGWMNREYKGFGFDLGIGVEHSIRGQSWDFPVDVFTDQTVREFINIAQRKVQAVKFISAMSYQLTDANIADIMERLVSLRNQGRISESEFEAAKRKALS